MASLLHRRRLRVENGGHLLESQSLQAPSLDQGLKEVLNISTRHLLVNITAHKSGLTLTCGNLTNHMVRYIASSPGPLFIFFERAWCACYITLDQRGCVHGDASFHHGDRLKFTLIHVSQRSQRSNRPP